MTNFFDTYALIEMLKENPSHTQFKDQPIITGILNIGELYYKILKELGKEEARKVIKKLQAEIIELDQETLLKSMEFRHENKKKDLSMVDCIGYFLAAKAQLKFVTGDKQFENMEKVLFVK